MTTARQHEGSQGAAYRPPLLDLKRIVAFTDAAQALFQISYDWERLTRQANEARLKAEMRTLDLFGLTVNRQDSEVREYQSDDDRDWCP